MNGIQMMGAKCPKCTAMCWRQPNDHKIKRGLFDYKKYVEWHHDEKLIGVLTRVYVVHRCSEKDAVLTITKPHEIHTGGENIE